MVEQKIEEREMGLCVSLPDCPQFAALIHRNMDKAEKQAFRLRSCGFYFDKPLVCCSTEQLKPTESTSDASIVSEAALLPKPGVCGKSVSVRIIDGNETQLHEHRWMALLQYTDPFGSKDFLCGGTLINQRYVLTAAHCIPGKLSNWRLTHVRLGEWDLDQDRDCERGECAADPIEVPIQETIPHETYDPNTTNRLHDIALVRLEQEVTYSAWIRPICLPTQQNIRTSNLVGNSMEVVGWGKTKFKKASNIKLKAKLRVVDSQKCNDKYKRRYSIVLETSQLCAAERGVDACTGDSGGPLIGTTATENYLPYSYVAGIVSMGPSPCAEKNVPGVYTRVGAYIDWIESKIQP